MLRNLILALGLTAALGACAAEPPGRAGGATAAAPAAALPAQADEAAITAAMGQLLPGTPIERIGPSPLPGLAEVAVRGRVLYISNDGRYLLVEGSLIDVPGKVNLTRLSEGSLRRDLLDAVPAERRIIFPAAEQKHRVTVFTDIDCGYCRQLHQQIADYNRLGITVEYLFYPRAGIGSESFEQAVAVWCSHNRTGALTAAKGGLVLPPANCDNPVRADYELGQKVGVTGTPAIYAENGVEIGGYLAPSEMLARLEEMAAQAR
ncbi:thioredoxin fold domain-containing protein [Arenimonas composti]|uniref:Thiol:disulfide interchange protein n=1 Tax=Arenimonas composti TR7-09 = DSM 18010 TaxID=1121013 RepID=A0A091BF53_9GAMM|nr:thioredoxin fold domain-containing protein [Arenimonas composti]KFN51338.1 hypothetical protein P873_03460 [Arenimonas composti TR7-09 = DSM 18010]